MAARRIVTVFVLLFAFLTSCSSQKTPNSTESVFSSKEQVERETDVISTIRQKIENELDDTSEIRNLIAEFFSENYLSIRDLEQEIREHFASQKADFPKPPYATSSWLLYSFVSCDNRLLLVQYDAAGIIFESYAEDIFSDEVFGFCNQVLRNNWMLDINVSSQEEIVYKVFTTAPSDVYIDIKIAFLTDEMVFQMNESAVNLENDVRKTLSHEKPLLVLEDLYVIREICFMP